VESWRAKLLHRKLRFHGYDAILRHDSAPGEWQVILPVVADGGAQREVHFDQATHERARELRTVKLRDVSGAVRTVYLHDVAEQLATMTVCDVKGRERTFRVKVQVSAPATPLEHKQGIVQALRALHECSRLLSGWDRIRLRHPPWPSAVALHARQARPEGDAIPSPARPLAHPRASG
jgi:hypothetical protein